MYSTNCGTHSQRCSAYEKNTSFVEFWLRSRQKRYLAKRWSKASRHSNGPKARFRIEDVLHHENSEGTGRRPVPNAAGRPSWARSLPNRVAGGAKRSWQLGLAEERAQLVFACFRQKLPVAPKWLKIEKNGQNFRPIGLYFDELPLRKP